MRKSTLVLVVIAAAVVGFVYWQEFKRTPTEQTATNPAVFHFQPEDVDSVTLSGKGGTTVLERSASGWQITQPVQTRAAKTPVDGLLNDVTLAHSSRSLTPTGDELKTYGLVPPAATIAFKLKNGQRHELKLGNTDFSGSSVYAQADQSKQVILVPNSVLTDGAKTVADLRDNSVLGISADDVQSFDLRSAAANIEAARSGSSGSDWSIEKPRKVSGDSTAIGNLLSAVSEAKLAKIVSENAGHLARYGLDRPGVSFQVHLKSGPDRTLELGRRQGDQFYARDTSRKMVFLVPASLRRQLALSLFDLRDKKLLHSLPNAFNRIDYRAGTVQFSCGVNNTGKWVMFQPAADKDKAVANWKVFNPLSSASAKAIIDSPSAALRAELEKPAVVIDLTGTDGGKKTFRISRPVGSSVYVSMSGQTALYQVAQSDLDSLLFKSATDILQ